MFFRALVACWLPLAAAASPPQETLFSVPLQALDGHAVHLSQFQGEPLLINVWASWCGPCREEMPALQRLMESRPPFRILTVAMDEDKNLVREFLIKFGLDLPVLLITRPQSATTLAPRGLPTTWLIDASGRIVTPFVGPRPWSDPATRQALIQRLAPSSGSARSMGMP